MRPIVIIPARMAASRLPGKPLADIGGAPLIVRVLRRAQAAGVGPVVVAAGDVEIVAAVEAAGGRAVLTDPGLPSGSDRVLAALNAVDPERQFDVAINLQGDIPFFEPGLVRACADLLDAEPSCDISTLIVRETGPQQRSDPDTPKAIVALADGARAGRALYFTRSTLYGDAPVWRHIGLYGYRRAALERFCAAPPSRSSGARSSNSCARSNSAFRSGRRWSRPRRSRSTIPPISPRRAPMRSSSHDRTPEDRLPGRARRQQPRGLPQPLPGL